MFGRADVVAGNHREMKDRASQRTAAALSRGSRVRRDNPASVERLSARDAHVNSRWRFDPGGLPRP